MFIVLQSILLIVTAISFIGFIGEKEDGKRQELLFMLIISIMISTLLALTN